MVEGARMEPRNAVRSRGNSRTRKRSGNGRRRANSRPSTVNELLKRFPAVVEDIRQERGECTLFGIFHRLGGWNRWDVVVAAPWVKEGRAKAIDYLVPKIRARLRRKDMMLLLAVSPFPDTEPSVRELRQTVEFRGAPVEVRNFTFAGVEIERAYIFALKKLRNGSRTAAA